MSLNSRLPHAHVPTDKQRCKVTQDGKGEVSFEVTNMKLCFSLEEFKHGMQISVRSADLCLTDVPDSETLFRRFR